MPCRHHYQYTQGYFFCIKCGHKRYARHAGRKNSSKKIIIPIASVVAVALALVTFGGNITQDMLSSDVPKMAEDIRQIPEIEKTVDQIRQKVDSTSESIKEHVDTTTDAISDQIDSVTKSTQKPEIQVDILEQKIHDLINEQRQGHGLPALEWDDTIAGIARAHSADMVNRNYFAHDSPDGAGPDVRGKKYGYDQCGDRDMIALSQKYDDLSRQFEASGNTDQQMYFQLQQMYSQLNTAISSGMIFGGLSENIAQDNLYDRIWYTNGVATSYEWNTMDDIAFSVVDGWMNSPGHRQNILTPYYYSQGIGVAISSDDKVYVTENFC